MVVRLFCFINMMSKRNQSDVDVGWHTQHTPASSVLISISSLVLYDVTETVDKSLLRPQRVHVLSHDSMQCTQSAILI